MSGNRLAAMSDNTNNTDVINDSRDNGISNHLDHGNIDYNSQEVIVTSRPNEEVSMHLDNSNSNSNSNTNTNATNDPLSMTIGNASSQPMISEVNEMDDWEANSTSNITAEESFSRQATVSLDERSSVPQEQSTHRHSQQEREREEILEHQMYLLHHLQENYLEMMQARHNAFFNTHNDVSSMNTNNNSERFHELLALTLRGRNSNVFVDNESVEPPLDTTRDLNNINNNSNNNNNNNSDNRKSVSERQRTREMLHNRPRLTVHSVPLIIQAPVLLHKKWSVPLFSMRLLCPCLAGESRRLFLEISEPSPFSSNSCDERENTELSNSSSALESQSNSLSFESSPKLIGRAGKSQLHHRHNGKTSQIQESRPQQSQNSNNQSNNSHRETSQTSSVPYGESADEIDTMQGEAQLNSLHTNNNINNNNNNNNIAEVQNYQNVEVQRTNEMPSPVRSLNPLSTPARILQQQQERLENQQNVNNTHLSSNYNNGNTRRGNKNKKNVHLKFHHPNSQHVSVYIPKLSVYNDVFNNTIMLDVFDNVVRSKRSSV